ncbi:hypothetical protein BJX66DRAFT_303143 [Aspergillus keveii]|uniref:Secreted protein n=1 Tax=Aspergillus keveii TaxID=714993 RepID=A0ABR4G7V9_9EURO
MMCWTIGGSLLSWLWGRPGKPEEEEVKFQLPIEPAKARSGSCTAARPLRRTTDGVFFETNPHVARLLDSSAAIFPVVTTSPGTAYPLQEDGVSHPARHLRC